MMQAHALAVENQEVVAPLASPFADADEQYEAIKGRLVTPEVRRMTHSEVESLLEVEGRELLRRLYQNHLDLRSLQERELGVEGPVIGADGVVRTDLRDGGRGLTTVFGEVRADRLAHHTPGTSSLMPLDAALNLPKEKYSFGVRRRCADEASKGSFDEAVESIRTNTGARIAKRQLEEEVLRAARDFAAFYATREVLAAGRVAELGEILVLTTDAKGVVMLKKALREATQKAAEREEHKLSGPDTKAPKKNRKRMAQAAAVYTVKPFVRTPEDIVRELNRRDETPKVRPRPENKRVWASVSCEPEHEIRAAFEEAARRDPEHEKIWVALSDGNEQQLWLLEKLALEYGVRITVVLDVIHVLGYLWKAASAFEKQSSPEAEKWVGEHFLAVLRGKATDVAAGIRRSATKRGLSASQRKPADTCAAYLHKYAEYMHYAKYLARGLPIATGVIEGACRHLVKDRMEITGARWGLDSAEAVLRLRSIRSSGDFAEYWAFHERQEFDRNHAEKYANGEIPAMCQPTPRPRGGRPHLRVVR